MTVEDHKIEVVRRFKYLGTVISDSNDEQKKFELGSWQLIKPTAPCKPYSDLNKSIKTTKQRLYTTLIKPISCYGSVTWTLTQTAEQMLNTFERKTLRRICDPTQEGGMLAFQME